MFPMVIIKQNWIEYLLDKKTRAVPIIIDFTKFSGRHTSPSGYFPAFSNYFLSWSYSSPLLFCSWYSKGFSTQLDWTILQKYHHLLKAQWNLLFLFPNKAAINKWPLAINPTKRAHGFILSIVFTCAHRSSPNFKTKY